MSGLCVPTLHRKKSLCEGHKTTCYFVCFRKDAGISLGKKNLLFLSLSHTQILGAHISLCLRGPLAIGQAGNLASPPLFGHNIEEFIINKSSIHRIRQIKRKESAESITVAFQNDISQILTVHWDGKLLPALNVRDTKEERLPIIVSFGDREQLIGVPKLQNATGKEQAHAVWIALTHWCLETNVQRHNCFKHWPLKWCM
ncbi:hypothetical protein AVEN_53872-1 [Araneus ventricosus]|uniref:Uncharacterized protein n=1 Tax=Araneus ventricosus TaxID=182803 RepID=A0A4Y2RY25_ARAVE|nr:hypothetical protein AVEN_53872-1 [Araneus ventricosus]